MGCENEPKHRGLAGVAAFCCPHVPFRHASHSSGVQVDILDRMISGTKSRKERIKSTFKMSIKFGLIQEGRIK